MQAKSLQVSVDSPGSASHIPVQTPGSQMFVLKCPAFTWVLGFKSGSLGLLNKFLFTSEPSPQSRQYSFYRENGKNSSEAYAISNKYFKDKGR